MRIAFISFEFPPQTLGGIGTYARHTVEMLLARGHDVTVFCGSGVDGGARETSAANVRRLRCDDRTSFHAVAVPALAKEHASAPFDIAEAPDLHAESLGLREQAPDLPLVLRAHTPFYIPAEVDFHALGGTARKFWACRRILGGLLNRQPWRKTWTEARERASFRALYQRHLDPDYRAALSADVIAPPSQLLARRLRQDWALPAEKVHVLPYAHRAAPDLLALPPSSGARTIAFHGSVRRFKGVHVLIAAMPVILQRHPQARLVLAGASSASPVPRCSWRAWQSDTMLEWQDTTEWLRPQLSALGDRVSLSGFVRPENVAEHLAAADVCVFPSLFDNFPSACLEAMSAGRAIVATRSGGMEEMLAPTTAGLLAPPGDASALARAIVRLLDDSSLRQQLGARARARVLAAYAPDVIGPLYEELYRTVIARRHRAVAPKSFAAS